LNKMKLPVMTRISQTFHNNEKGESVDFTGKPNQKPIMRDVLQDGIIGGYTFSDGSKSLIYQCGICGNLLEFGQTWNDHHREHDSSWVGMMFGSAEPVVYDCLTDKIDEALIQRAKN
jgi:hypothetical protein